jgi:hypothetical protein
MKGEVWGGGRGQRDGREAGTRKHFEAAGTRALGRGGVERGDRRGIRERGGSDRFRNAPRGGFIRGLLVRELPLERRTFVLLGLRRARLGGSRALRLQLRNLILLVRPRGDVAAQAAAAPQRCSRHPARLGALGRRRIRASRRGSCRSSGDARGSALVRPPAPVRVGSRRARDPRRWLGIDRSTLSALRRVSVCSGTPAPRGGHFTRRERRGRSRESPLEYRVLVPVSRVVPERVSVEARGAPARATASGFHESASAGELPWPSTSRRSAWC